MKAIDVAIMLFALVVLFACCACGPKITVQGGTTHTVQGESTVRVVVGVDTTVCDGMEPAARTECIQSLLDIAKMVSESKDQEQTGFGGIY